MAFVRGFAPALSEGCVNAGLGIPPPDRTSVLNAGGGGGGWHKSCQSARGRGGGRGQGGSSYHLSRTPGQAREEAAHLGGGAKARPGGGEEGAIPISPPGSSSTTPRTAARIQADTPAPSVSQEPPGAPLDPPTIPTHHPPPRTPQRGAYYHQQGRARSSTRPGRPP